MVGGVGNGCDAEMTRVEDAQFKTIPRSSIKGIAIVLSNSMVARHLEDILARLEYHVCGAAVDQKMNHIYLVDTHTLSQVWPNPRVLYASSLSPSVIDVSVRTQCLGIIVPSQGLLELKATLDIALSVASAQCALEKENGRLWRKLRERKTIEMAKEILKKRYQFDEESAYRMIRYEAMNSRRTLGEVAEMVLLKNE